MLSNTTLTEHPRTWWLIKIYRKQTIILRYYIFDFEVFTLKRLYHAYFLVSINITIHNKRALLLASLTYLWHVRESFRQWSVHRTSDLTQTYTRTTMFFFGGKETVKNHNHVSYLKVKTLIELKSHVLSNKYTKTKQNVPQ